MDIIKSVTICGTYHLTMVYFTDIKEYEVQYSNNEDIIEYDGTYSRKSEALKVFNVMLKELIVEDI